MVRKEINEVLKQALYLVLSVAVLPVLICLAAALSKSPQAFLDVFFPTFQAGLLFWALFSGISLFAADRKGQGIEYILSLPYSRLQLLAFKLLPRLAALAGFYGLYLVLYYTIGLDHVFMAHMSFSCLYVILFLLSLTFSVSRENFVISVLLSLFTFVLFLAVLFLLFWLTLSWRGGQISGFQFQDVTNSWVFLAVFILVVPFVVSFGWAFKRFDLRPVRNYTKRYLKLFIPLLVVCLGLSLIFAYQSWDWGYRGYYLTREHKLIEYDGYRTRVYDGEGAREIETFHVYDIEMESGNDLYYTRRTREGDTVWRINLDDYRSEIFYQPQGAKKFNYWFCRFANSLLLFERVKGEKRRVLVSIDMDLLAVEKIDIPLEISRDKPVLQLLGTDVTEGRRYWLITPASGRSYPVSRVWEDGTWQQLTTGPKSPVYVNRLLIHYDREAMLISKLTPGGLEPVKRLPAGREVEFIAMSRCLDLNPQWLGEIYGTCFDSKQMAYRGIYRLDMNEMTLTMLGDRTGHLYYFYPRDFYWAIYGHDRDNNYWVETLFRLKNGEMKRLKKFENVDPRQYFHFSKAGLVLKQDGRTRVYALPDMKALTFRGLN